MSGFLKDASPSSGTSKLALQTAHGQVWMWVGMAIDPTLLQAEWRRSNLVMCSGTGCGWGMRRRGGHSKYEQKAWGTVFQADADICVYWLILFGIVTLTEYRPFCVSTFRLVEASYLMFGVFHFEEYGLRLRVCTVDDFQFLYFVCLFILELMESNQEFVVWMILRFFISLVCNPIFDVWGWFILQIKDFGWFGVLHFVLFGYLIFIRLGSVLVGNYGVRLCAFDLCGVWRLETFPIRMWQQSSNW